MDDLFVVGGCGGGVIVCFLLLCLGKSVSCLICLYLCGSVLPDVVSFFFFFQGGGDMRVCLFGCYTGCGGRGGVSLPVIQDLEGEGGLACLLYRIWRERRG